MNKALREFFVRFIKRVRAIRIPVYVSVGSVTVGQFPQVHLLRPAKLILQYLNILQKKFVCFRLFCGKAEFGRVVVTVTTADFIHVYIAVINSG